MLIRVNPSQFFFCVKDGGNSCSYWLIVDSMVFLLCFSVQRSGRMSILQRRPLITNVLPLGDIFVVAVVHAVVVDDSH